ncbi:MAG: hypothetical protein II370_04505 [Clostridia bacterium]|nr:hypothetical protein [Clostridia bacterium]MBQ5808340.1 hypothetical protein [Clostridia bacterium]
MIREDDREILTAEKIRKDEMELARFSLGTSALGTVLSLGITAFFIAIIPIGFKVGMVLFDVVWSAVVAFVAVITVMGGLDTFDKFNVWLMYRNYEFDVVEATVSMKTERVEVEYCTLWRLKYRSRHSEAVNHHYMFFKDYGEIRCGERVKEGDAFYLAIRKKDRKIMNAYSAIRYRFKG